VCVEAVGLGTVVATTGDRVGSALASVGGDGLLQLLCVAVVEDLTLEERLIQEVASNLPASSTRG
jgi:hypothetical protein